jgi:hypothetical protein
MTNVRRSTLVASKVTQDQVILSHEKSSHHFEDPERGERPNIAPEYIIPFSFTTPHSHITGDRPFIHPSTTLSIGMPRIEKLCPRISLNKTGNFPKETPTPASPNATIVSLNAHDDTRRRAASKKNPNARRRKIEKLTYVSSLECSFPFRTRAFLIPPCHMNSPMPALISSNSIPFRPELCQCQYQYSNVPPSRGDSGPPACEGPDLSFRCPKAKPRRFVLTRVHVAGEKG